MSVVGSVARRRADRFVDIAACRRLRAIERLADLAVSQVEDEAEDDRRPLLRRQSGDPLPERVVGTLRRRGAAIASGSASASGRRERATVLVDRLVTGDRQQPGPRARTVESGIGAKGRDHRLLEDVIDVVGGSIPRRNAATARAWASISPWKGVVDRGAFHLRQCFQRRGSPFREIGAGTGGRTGRRALARLPRRRREPERRADLTDRPCTRSDAVRGRLALAAVVLVGARRAAMLAPASSPAKTKWLCKPGAKPNPCKGSLETTDFAIDGSSTIETPRERAQAEVRLLLRLPDGQRAADRRTPTSTSTRSRPRSPSTRPPASPRTAASSRRSTGSSR